MLMWSTAPLRSLIRFSASPITASLSRCHCWSSTYEEVSLLRDVLAISCMLPRPVGDVCTAPSESLPFLLLDLLEVSSSAAITRWMLARLDDILSLPVSWLLYLFIKALHNSHCKLRAPTNLSVAIKIYILIYFIRIYLIINQRYKCVCVMYTASEPNFTFGPRHRAAFA